MSMGFGLAGYYQTVLQQIMWGYTAEVYTNSTRQSVIFYYTKLLGLGRVRISTVRVESSSYLSNPATFTLIASSSGGPPSTSIWTRNGVTITNNSVFRVNLTPRCDSGAVCTHSLYESTLTVFGKLPGQYRYSVSNRASSSHSSTFITINGQLK